MGRSWCVALLVLLGAGQLACSGSSHGAGSTGSTGTGSSSGSTGTTGNSGSSGSTGSIAPVSDYPSFCRQLNLSICGLDHDCGLVPAQFSCAAHADDYRADCGLQLAIDSAGANTCLADLDRQRRNGWCYLSTDYRVLCLGVVGPAVQPGGACQLDTECAPLADGGVAHCVYPSPTTCGGTCGARVPQGGYCSMLDVCADGRCLEGVCVPFLAEGASCLSELGCDPARDYCSVLTDPPACASLLPQGASCIGNDCAAGLACVTIGGITTCQPAGGVGGLCDPAGSDCGAGLACLSLDGGLGSCTALVPAGGACPGRHDEVCGTNLVCRDGVCTAFAAMPGQPCGRGVRCLGICDNLDGGTCHQALPPGAFCNNDNECGSGYAFCQDGVCTVPGLGSSDCSVGACPPSLHCYQGACLAAGETGEPCKPGDPQSCLRGWCDASSQSCRLYLAPGAACDPTQISCGFAASEINLSDGGFAYRDANCLVSDAGYICQSNCAAQHPISFY